MMGPMSKPSRVSRRAFIGMAAGAAAVPAVTAGCQQAGPGAAARPGDPAAPARRGPVSENAKPGNPDWDVKHLGGPSAIMGYAGQYSVLPGEKITLYVSTTARSFTIKAFRMGWYHGDLARLVWKSGTVPGHRQPRAELIKPTNTVQTTWHPTAMVPTDDWPEGSYLLRLDSEAGPQRFVPVTVRSAATKGKTVIKNGVATWQAYNTWGGYDLYNGPGGITDYGNRSLAVSLDRPYDQMGAYMFLFHERKLIDAGRTDRHAARVHHQHGHRARPAPAGRGQRADLARPRRVLVAAGAGQRHRGQERRREHRVPGRELLFPADPAGQHPARRPAPGHLLQDQLHCRTRCTARTTRWSPATGGSRRTRTPSPSLTGTLYESNPTTADYVVASPKSWLFAGTGVRKGTRFPGLVGIEYDRVNPDSPVERPIEILSHSPLTCRGVNSYADSAYYTHASGAGCSTPGRCAGSRPSAAGTATA